MVGRRKKEKPRAFGKVARLYIAFVLRCEGKAVDEGDNQGEMKALEKESKSRHLRKRRWSIFPLPEIHSPSFPLAELTPIWSKTFRQVTVQEERSRANGTIFPVRWHVNFQ